MKKYLAIFAFIIVFLNTQKLVAQDYKASAGLRLGTYFSTSVKVFISENAAVEGILGISREGGQSLFTTGGFYKIHNQFTTDIPSLKWYFGGGAFVALAKDDIPLNLALASIIGLEFTLNNAPINIFIDGIPYLSLNNEFSFDAEASLGARYIF